jgi:hypothetical protein
MASKHNNNDSEEQRPAFEAHPEHAAAVNQAIQAIRQLVQDNPEFADELRLAATTDDVRKLLQAKGIEITTEALWRHRGSILSGGNLTWRG